MLVCSFDCTNGEIQHNYQDSKEYRKQQSYHNKIVTCLNRFHVDMLMIFYSIRHLYLHVCCLRVNCTRSFKNRYMFQTFLVSLYLRKQPVMLIGNKVPYSNKSDIDENLEMTSSQAFHQIQAVFHPLCYVIAMLVNFDIHVHVLVFQCNSRQK